MQAHLEATCWMLCAPTSLEGRGSLDVLPFAKPSFSFMLPWVLRPMHLFFFRSILLLGRQKSLHEAYHLFHLALGTQEKLKAQRDLLQQKLDELGPLDPPPAPDLQGDRQSVSSGVGISSALPSGRARQGGSKACPYGPRLPIVLIGEKRGAQATGLVQPLLFLCPAPTSWVGWISSLGGAALWWSLM